MSAHEPAPPPLHRDRQVIAAIMAAVVGAIVAAVAATIIASPSGSANNASGSGTPTGGATTPAVTSPATTSSVPASPKATLLAYETRGVDTYYRTDVGDAKVNGTVRPDSVYIEENCQDPFGRMDPQNVTYDLDRRYHRLRLLAGLRDDSSENSRARMTVYGDGRRLAGADVSVGKSAPVNVDVTGVLRLKLEVVWTAGWECQPRLFTTAVWGTPTVT